MNDKAFFGIKIRYLEWNCIIWKEIEIFRINMNKKEYSGSVPMRNVPLHREDKKRIHLRHRLMCNTWLQLINTPNNLILHPNPGKKLRKVELTTMSTNPLCLKRALLLKSVWGFASSHHATRYNPIRSDRSFADSESDGEAEDGEAFWPGKNRRPGCPPCGGLSWDCRNQENMKKSSGWWGTWFFSIYWE